MSLIPGYLSVITANGTSIETVVEVADFEQNRNITTKRLMGTQSTEKVSGKIDRSWSLRGNLKTDKAAALQALFALNAPFSFSLQIGEAGQATDAGLYAGSALAGQYRISGNADGDYAISLNLDASGDVTYTPPSSS